MPGDVTAIRGATILPLDRPGALRDWGVLVRGGVIVEMRPTAELPVPEGAEMVDAEGRYLLPGFVDMHVHIGFPALLAGLAGPERERLEEESAADLALYLANGVTTVRNMAGAPFHRRLARAVERGERSGPRVRSASPILDGDPPVWAFSPVIRSEADARDAVQAARSEGYEAIKVYNHLSAEAYAALRREGEAAGLPLVGHVPFAVGIEGALAARQRSIEHFRGYDFDPAHPPGRSGVPDRFHTWLKITEAQLAAYAEATRAAGTWNCPTFVTVDSCAAVAEAGADALPETARHLSPSLRRTMLEGIARPVFTPEVMRVIGKGKPTQLRLLKLMHEAGCGLLVGTDASLLTVVPGFSLHDELASFVSSGLTPYEALVCCCRNPALFYGEKAAGRVAPGAPADLVLLDADPLADVANTRRIAGVMTRGRWFDAERLRSMLAEASEDAGPLFAGSKATASAVPRDRTSQFSRGERNDAA